MFEAQGVRELKMEKNILFKKVNQVKLSTPRSDKAQFSEARRRHGG